MQSLFLDDIRNPHGVKWAVTDIQNQNIKLPDTVYDIVRNYDEFVAYIDKQMPDMITFDHDLADEHYNTSLNPDNFKEKTGLHCANYLVEKCINEKRRLPIVYVHSMNPIGKRNIISLCNSAKRNFDFL